MPEEACARARKQRRRGREIPEIAADLGYPEEVVELALASMRTPNRRRSRATLNVTLETGDFVRSQQGSGERIWQTVGRLLTELATLRAEVIGLRARVGATGPASTP
jgi:hypothetical protein